MPSWTFDLWILQWLGLIAAGAGALAVGIALAERVRLSRRSAGVGVAGNLPATPGINMARINVGGDIGGLVLVIGLICAFMPDWWPWFLAVAVGSVIIAVGLFWYHRHRPGR